MPIETALPSDHPMMVAWNKWQESDEFKNCLIWSLKENYDDGREITPLNREQHVKGALWLAFTKGMELPLERIAELEARLAVQVPGGAPISTRNVFHDKDTTCRNCAGSGRLPEKDSYGDQEPCPSCGGTGRWP